MKKVIIGIGVLGTLAAAGWFIWNQATLLSDMDFSLLDKKIVSINLSQVVIQLTIKVINKSKLALQLNGYDIQVKIDSKPVARLVSTRQEVIPGNGSSNIIITASVAYSDVFGAAASGDTLVNVLTNKSKVILGVSGQISGKLGNAISVKNFPIDITTPLSDVLPKA